MSSLYESKPPISRAKMANVTKCAIKAIKFYKHVVQSVEKFIQKCKPEYKVPGLYVIDSVVRQSRHQFGPQKDVFAQRFTKNIIATFQNLLKCPADERSKIVRVLNLWQKNEVFPSEIIQPLLDLAADPTKPALLAAAQAAVDRVLAASGKNSGSHGRSAGREDSGQGGQSAAENMLATQNDMLNTVTQLLQNTNSGSQSLDAQQQQLQQLQTLQQQLIQQTALMQQPSGGSGPLIDANLLAQIQTLTNQLLQKTESKQEDGGFNKKLLDFDYGDSDDEGDKQNNIQGEVRTILQDQGLMQQIHQVSQTIQKNHQYSAELSDQERRRILEQQQEEFNQQIALSLDRSGGAGYQGGEDPPMPDGAYPEEGEYTEDQLQDEDFRDHQQLRDREDRDRSRSDRRRRSRDRSRSPKRRKRSRSKERRRRSRSRERHRDRRSRSKDKDREKERREKERERKKRGIPAVRANFVTICTNTIWIGHLNKFTAEEELKAEVERYGPVLNINMVPPRGCAYVVMENRKDAFKAIDRLRGYKLNSSALKTAWAQSTGMRASPFKDSWDVDEGAIYLPWDSLPADLSSYLDGSIIDAESLPEHLKDIQCEGVKEEPDVSMPPMPNMASMANQMMQGQPPMMGMMGGPPPMPGMMPGMMMGPMVGNIPPPQGMPPMPPGPPPMMPVTSQIPGMPGMRPPAPGMNMATSAAANSLAQTIQNIMSTTAGVVPGSPSVPPRPTGFTGFGFNPNMPPPGFRLPPPGFTGAPVNPLIGSPAGMRPPQPGEAPGPRPPFGLSGDRPLVPTIPPGQGSKQPEMMWPPDSNEMDEDLDDEDEGDNGPPPGQFNRGMNFMGRPPIGGRGGPDGMRGRGGPPTPGTFSGEQWGMNRMGGGPMGRGMSPMGPMGRGGPPNRFGGHDMPGVPPRGMSPLGAGGRGGFGSRFGGGPMSLLDMPDIQPNRPMERPNFLDENDDEYYEEEQETGNEQILSEETGNDESINEPVDEVVNDEQEGNVPNCYPFNSWQTVRVIKKPETDEDIERNGNKWDRKDDRDRRDGDRKDDRDRRDGDRDKRDGDRERRDGDRRNDRDRRDGDRKDERDRRDGDRDRRDGDRRNDRSRDNTKDSKDNRETGRDREKSRKSRWGNWDEEQEAAKMLEKEAAENAGNEEHSEGQENTNVGESDVHNESANIDSENLDITGVGNSSLTEAVPAQDSLHHQENAIKESHADTNYVQNVNHEHHGNGIDDSVLSNQSEDMNISDDGECDESKITNVNEETVVTYQSEHAAKTVTDHASSGDSNNLEKSNPDLEEGELSS
ncbi:hypothetical protein DPMN_054160 [Dreissena polymorpha]|uniref:Splicing factor, arginine/serine-rich 15 n=1 Tax=Dreissena polymorpha TaxID=45954 RepID=A0A9D4CMP4_DREPO|nr:hypothetical protein DPMN_054160 [Dreissena polymorpha]